MEKILSKKELYAGNIIAVKTEKQKRTYKGIGSISIVKDINRTKYLKICWMCGKSYESYRISSYACQNRCSQNIIRLTKNGFNPPTNMNERIKPKNVKEIKELFGYR